MNWHTREAQALLRSLKTTADGGLSIKQVATLQERYGFNSLEQEASFTIFKGIRKQLFAPLSLVLILALLVTIFLQEYTDALVICAALLINVVIGVLQEGKAAKVFEELAAAAETKATVIRDGLKQVIASKELVPGDVVVLESGHKVPADIRLLQADGLQVNESALTGEWVAVEKNAKQSEDPNAPLTAQTNMAFMGTVVAEGFGTGVVVATGEEAQFGKVATKTAAIEDEHIPLQRSIAKLAHSIVAIIGVVIALIFILGILHGGTVSEMLLIAVAVAVAAMPEGLPAAVTVTLALAMEQILRKGGLVKHLLGAETLGSTTTILTDKTGTLTEGVMVMRSVHTNAEMQVPADADGDEYEILKMAVLASDAFIDGEDDAGRPIVQGRPLEKAIVEGALAAGLRQDELFAHRNERDAFVSFAASRRYAISLNECPQGGSKIYLTGSPEHILSHSSKYLHHGKAEKLTDEIRAQFKKVQDELSATGARFTAVAYRVSSERIIPDDIKSPEEGENLGLVFGGLLAFSDSVRTEVPEAIATAKGAGMHVLMVTGDHAETARSVAKEVGLAHARVVTGVQAAKMNDDALLLAAQEEAIFARMLPEQKLRLATVLKNAGEVVAMTGDGVNDAPALTAANIGLAVDDGTDIAKEAADMILLKSSFSVIIAAIREGRRALTNLRKIVAYLLSTSASEIMLIGGAVAIGSPLPLLPAQILWANIVQEGFMSFPFAFEPAERGAMSRKPQRAGRQLLAGGFNPLIWIVSLTQGATLFIFYVILYKAGIAEAEIRTVMFAAISLSVICTAFSFKNPWQPIWRTGLFTNRYLLGGFGISLFLLGVSLTWEPLKTLLSLETLTLFDIAVAIGVALINIAIIEIAKHFLLTERSK